MIERMRNKAGFTLAELMMSIAIVLILAAIAFPSIFTAQNNMRMVELNNAAQSIANAAQAQMTSMKVSGTWMAFLDARAGEAKGTNYLLRDEARSSEIITSLSIDSTVYEGDYVIVFDENTASVTEVYYADGKSGFFGEAPANTTAAQNYYLNEGASTDQTDRMKHEPMIGYYEGTPAGATPEVALRNPVIWVDEATGRLMVQDPNISEDGTSGDTTTSVSIEDKTQSVSFEISGLSVPKPTEDVSDSRMISVSNDGAGSLGLSGDEAKKVLKQVKRDGSDGGNVFSIDLNALADLVDEGNNDALKALFAACQPDDDLAVRATTTSATTSSVPAIANANIKWPEPVGKLTLFVTNPYSETIEGKASAAYTPPLIRATDKNQESAQNGVAATPVAEDTENFLRDTAANRALVEEYEQAGYQSYTGGSVSSSRVRDDDTFRLEATVGSYGTHTYQIWEMWIKRSDNGDLVRVGYLNDSKWEWASYKQGGVSCDYSILQNCLTWYDKDKNAYGADYMQKNEFDTDALNITAVSLNARVLFATAETNPEEALVDKNGNATIYVRTAPKSSEVQEYFDGLAKDGKINSSYLNSGDGTEKAGEEVEETSSRSTTAASAIARSAFLAAFGASSSDVSWAVTKNRSAGFEQGDAYLADEEYQNVRVYYSIAPGLGFENIRTYRATDDTEYLTGMRSTRMTNVSLWLYRGDALAALDAMPAAMLRNEKGMYEYSCQKDGEGNDFKLSTAEDYRFYRVITYAKVESGEVPAQYVPHSAASDQDVATVASAMGYEDTNYIYTLSHWTTSDTTDGVVLNVEPQKLVADYETLALKGATLTAVYDQRRKGVGVVYVEFNEGNVSGWAGYTTNDQKSFEEKLTPDSVDITSFGYYVVVPTGKKPTVQDATDYREKSLTKEYENVDLRNDGIVYDLYRIGGYTSSQQTGYGEMRTSSRTVTYYCDGQSAGYTFNLNFAAAVAKKGDTTVDAGKWGSGDSPWLVRHALQFPGALPGNTTSNGIVQAAYQGKNVCFKQSHDIDMASTRINNTYKYEWTFSGVYDGGSYLIKNVHSRFLEASADITIKDGADGRAWGLFSATKDAVIKNVKIKENADKVWSMKGTNGFSVGLLVGVASGGRIENCTIEGGNAVVHVLTSNRNGQTNFGGLVGKASGVEIDGCSVSNMTLRLTATSDWINEPAIGGLVGYLSNAKVNSSSDGVAIVASKVSLEIETKPSENKTLRFGAVAGLADGAEDKTKITNSIAQEVSMTAPAMKDEARRRVLFGTYLGSFSGEKDPISSVQDPIKITYRFGEENYTDVTKEIGDAAPVDGISEEAS